MDPAHSSICLVDILALAQRQHVSLMIVGTPEDFSLKLATVPVGISFSTVDYKAVGTALGTQMAACVNSKTVSRTDLMFNAAPVGTVGKLDLENTMLTVLKQKALKIKVVNKILAPTRAGALTTVRNNLDKYKNIKAYFANGDDALLGGLAGFNAAKRKSLCTVGYAKSAEALALVKSRAVYSTVVLDFAADFVQTTEELKRLTTQAGAVKGKQLSVPMVIITK